MRQNALFTLFSLLLCTAIGAHTTPPHLLASTDAGAAIPVITSDTDATVDCDSEFSYFITASDDPTSYNATGLPAGLMVNTATGEISGTPTTAAGSPFVVTLSATNADGTGIETLTLTVNSYTPEVSLSVTSAVVTEHGTSYTISVDGIACDPVAYSVDVSVVPGGSAPPGDYSFTSPTTLNFSDSETQTAIVTIVNNELEDGNRTIDFELSNCTNCNLGSNNSLTLTILDEDLSYTNGDWRTTQDGAGLGLDGSGWESYDGTSWSVEALAPENCGCTPNRIIIQHANIDGGGNANNSAPNTPYDSDIIVTAGSELNLEDESGNPNNFNDLNDFLSDGFGITVENYGTLNVRGDIQLPSNASLTAEANGKITIDQATVNLGHPMYAGTEDFQDGSTYEVLNYDWSSSSSDHRLLDPTASNPIAQNSSGDGYYFGNVEINATPDNVFTLVGSNSVLNAFQNDLTIKNGSATESILLTANANSPEITIGGDVIVENGLFGFGTQFGGGSGTQKIFVKGDLNLNGTVSLREMHIGSNNVITEVYVEGDITVEGGTFQTADDPSLTNNGLLIATGANEQTFSNSGTVDLYDVKIDKSADILALNTDLQVKNLLTMTSGDIFTGISKLILGESATAPGTLDHTSGFVVGTMERWFDAATNSGNASGLFPLGNASGQSRFALIEFTTAPASGGTITANFEGTAMGDVELLLAQGETGDFPNNVFESADEGFWNMDAGNGLSGGVFNAAFTGEGFAGTAGLEMLTLIYGGSGNWSAPGSHVGAVSGPIVSRTGLSAFGEFGFGGSEGSLPVELLYFEARRAAGQSVGLDWATASELNNKGFEIEHSVDGRSFSYVHFLAGAGTSSLKQEYRFTHTQPAVGTNYYRLKQVDHDGNYDYSEVRAVQLSDAPFKLYPTVSNNTITLELDRELSQEGVVEVYDPSGKVVLQAAFPTSAQQQILEVGALAPGQYFLKVYSAEWNGFGRFVVR